jgi:hypothetical protein
MKKILCRDPLKFATFERRSRGRALQSGAQRACALRLSFVPSCSGLELQRRELETLNQKLGTAERAFAPLGSRLIDTIS